MLGVQRADVHGFQFAALVVHPAQVRVHIGSVLLELGHVVGQRCRVVPVHIAGRDHGKRPHLLLPQLPQRTHVRSGNAATADESQSYRLHILSCCCTPS